MREDRQQSLDAEAEVQRELQSHWESSGPAPAIQPVTTSQSVRLAHKVYLAGQAAQGIISAMGKWDYEAAKDPCRTRVAYQAENIAEQILQKLEEMEVQYGRSERRGDCW